MYLWSNWWSAPISSYPIPSITEHHNTVRYTALYIPPICYSTLHIHIHIQLHLHLIHHQYQYPYPYRLSLTGNYNSSVYTVLCIYIPYASYHIVSYPIETWHHHRSRNDWYPVKLQYCTILYCTVLYCTILHYRHHHINIIIILIPVPILLLLLVVVKVIIMQMHRYIYVPVPVHMIWYDM